MIELKVVSTQKVIFQKEVEMAVLPGTEGDFAAMPDHSPFISSLRPGQMVIMSKNKAEESFNNITINKNVPDDILQISISTGDIHLPNFLTENNLTKSNSEARRLITSGAFKIDEVKFHQFDIKSNDLLGKTLQIGKRKFLRINNK